VTGAVGNAMATGALLRVSGSCEVQQVSIAKRSNCCLHYV
jgi:hypothetical protein